jgi:GT2 family glycosyltransferase
MPDFDLSITICSWNTLEDTRACLASLERELKSVPFEVIVIDNNSEDGSPDMVRQEFAWVQLFALSRNLGFTGGHNYALERRNGRHALLLNSDTVVHEGAIQALLDYLEANPKIGILGPKLLNPDGSLQPSCRAFPNPVAALFRNTPIGRLFPNNRYTREYLMTDWDHISVRSVDWVSGAAMLARDQLIDQIGGLDPEYFMYCEDIDWCWRARKAGWDVVYYPGSVITHAVGHSTDKAPNRMIGRHHRSMLRFYNKNMIPELPWLVRPFAMLAVLGGVGLRAGLFILKNKRDDLKRRMAR